MKYLNWFKANINLISFIVGAGLVIAGRTDEGMLILKGAI